MTELKEAGTCIGNGDPRRALIQALMQLLDAMRALGRSQNTPLYNHVFAQDLRLEIADLITVLQMGQESLSEIISAERWSGPRWIASWTLQQELEGVANLRLVKPAIVAAQEVLQAWAA
jgi:hypothetical protein